MEQSYNLEQDSFFTNLVCEEKENYSLTPEQDALLPLDFTLKERQELHKWCHKLKFDDGVTGFIKYIDKNYLPNELHGEFNVNSLISARLKRYKDVVYMNVEYGHRIPFSVEDLITNLNNSWRRIVLFFTEPFNLYFFSIRLFHETISYRVNIKLKEAGHSPIILKKFEESISETISYNTLKAEDNLLLEKLRALYRKQIIEAKSMAEDYFGNDLLRNIYNNILKKTDNKNERFDCFSCTENEFINAINLKTNQKKIKITQNKRFFYLIVKLQERLASKFDKESIKKYRIELFKRIDDKRNLHNVYSYEASRLRGEVMRNEASELNKNFTKKVDEILE